MAAVISLISGSLGVVLVGAWNLGTYTELRPALLKEVNDYTEVQKAELNDYADKQKTEFGEYSSKTGKELEAVKKMASDAILLSFQARFNVLYDKYLKCDCLTFEEKQEMCRLAAQLNYTGIC